MGRRRFLLEGIGSFSIGCTVYSRDFEGNGLIGLPIGIGIGSKVLWKTWRSHDVPLTANNNNTENHHCAPPSLLTMPKTITVAENFVRMHNSWNFGAVRSHIASHLSFLRLTFPADGGFPFVRDRTKTLLFFWVF
ncbi:unnamed protein product [Hymenolepis diminuta]|uniref:Transmembrane protein n=1 Tax=Hymenolepis diminuta TaxID=6216 RepID=A0A0R3SZ22_HYMDI|nr:unnamed protein product [Hymenolepis diminuta]